MDENISNGMCQVLGLDENIYDMPTCIYHNLLEVKLSCAY
jgi:hypothetical protein